MVRKGCSSTQLMMFSIMSSSFIVKFLSCKAIGLICRRALCLVWVRKSRSYWCCRYGKGYDRGYRWTLVPTLASLRGPSILRLKGKGKGAVSEAWWELQEERADHRAVGFKRGIKRTCSLSSRWLRKRSPNLTLLSHAISSLSETWGENGMETRGKRG